ANFLRPPHSSSRTATFEDAASTNKVGVWAAMRHLFDLQLRSGAPQLKTRLVAAVLLVLAGKALGVLAPLFMGRAINVLADGRALGTQVAIAFVGLILGWSVIRLISSLAPQLRDVIFAPV